MPKVSNKLSNLNILKSKNPTAQEQVKNLASFAGTKDFFNYVEKYGWPKIIHQFTLKILFLIKNLLKVTLFSVKIL